MFSKKDYNLTDAFREIMKKAEKNLLLSLYKKNDFTFDFYLNEDMMINDFLKKLISRKPRFWSIIEKAIVSSPHVSIIYSDRYLNTPLGCLLLSQLIRQIRHYYQIHFDSIVLNISRTAFIRTKKSVLNHDFPEPYTEGQIPSIMYEAVGKRRLYRKREKYTTSASSFYQQCKMYPGDTL